jgi:carboxylesterase
MPGQIIPTAEPFFLPGGKTGCLLVHGFTGAPKEMRWMGEYLSGMGFSVLGVRLAGHATHLEDMSRTRWQDWLACVEDGWHILQGATTQTFIIGLSMGGALSLLFASQFPVSGVVAMSTPCELPPDPRLPLLRWLHWFSPTTPKGEPDWQDPELEKDHISYPVYPTRSILELKLLLAEMRAGLPRVSAPTLLMHARQDKGINLSNMSKIYAGLGSTDKEMLWIENSGHVLVRDAAREHVFQVASDFIVRVSHHPSRAKVRNP